MDINFGVCWYICRELQGEDSGLISAIGIKTIS